MSVLFEAPNDEEHAAALLSTPGITEVLSEDAVHLAMQLVVHYPPLVIAVVVGVLHEDFQRLIDSTSDELSDKYVEVANAAASAALEVLAELKAESEEVPADRGTLN